MNDIYSLLLADDEPTAQQKAAQLAAALRGTQQAAAANRGLAMVSGLGQNNLLAGLGKSSAASANALADQAQFGQQQLAGAGRQRAADALQKSIAAERRRQELYDEGSRRKWQEGRDTLRYQQEMEQAKTLAGQRERDRQDARDDRKAAQDDKAIADDAELLSKRMEGAPALKGDLQTLIKYAGEDDIPGVGPIAGRLPNWMISDEGTQVRQAIKGTVGNLIKERSGTAASDKEVERIMTELGMGDGATEAQFRQGLARLSQQSRDALRQKEAGARSEALDIAKRRGLTTSADIPSYSVEGGAAPAASDTVMVQPPDGRPPVLIRRTDLDEALKRGGKVVSGG